MAGDTERVAELVAFLRDYAARRLNSRLFDARRCLPPYVVLDLGRRGLLGLGVPPELGGLGLTWAERIPVVEQLAAIDLTLTMFVGIHNELGIGPILAFGSERLKQQLVPQLATGRMLGGLAITEPSAGSNPRALKATAELIPAGNWRLNGSKSWVGNGSWAGVLNVFARRTDGKLNGVLGFAVQTDSPGLEMGPEAMTTGMRAIVQNAVTLRDVEVPSHCLLGNADMDLVVAETSFRMARFGLAIAATGGLKRCLQLMLRYARHRQIATGPIADHPLFRSAITQAFCSMQILERLTALLAQDLDAGRSPPHELFFVCKVLGPEYLFSAADSAVQWLGGRGYIEANEAPQLLRDARLFRIFEGPTETMRAHLGALWRHQGGLRTFLADAGHAPAVLARIEAACDELWGTPKLAGSSVGQYTFARNCALGDVVAEGVAWWLADARACDDSTLQWARCRFEDACQRGRRLLSGVAVRLEELQSELERSIGNVTQTLPGEDWCLDATLATS